MPVITYRIARAIAQTMLNAIEDILVYPPNDEQSIVRVIESLKVHFTVSN